MTYRKGKNMEEEKTNFESEPEEGEEDPKEEGSSSFSFASPSPLLTPEQEIELGRLIQKGRKEGASEEDKKAGKEALDQMVEDNRGLVGAILKQYLCYGVPPEDLFQEGCIGLQTAAEKFDPERGTRFSTYASYWIKESIRRALNNLNGSIHVPAHMVGKIAKVRQAENTLSLKLGREPTMDELEESLPDLDPAEISSILQTNSFVLSLDEPMKGDEEDGDDRLSFQKGDDVPASSLDQEDEMRAAEEGLDALDEREKDIICRLFGLNGYEEQDSAEIGRVYGISRERVRQIKETAFRKMRESIRRKEGGE